MTLPGYTADWNGTPADDLRNPFLPEAVAANQEARGQGPAPLGAAGRGTTVGVRKLPGQGINYQATMPAQSSGALGGTNPTPPTGAMPPAPAVPAGGALPPPPNPYGGDKGLGLSMMAGGAAAMSSQSPYLLGAVGEGLGVFTKSLKEERDSVQSYLDKQELLGIKKEDSATKKTLAMAKLEAAGLPKTSAFMKELASTTDPSTGKPVVQGSAYWNEIMEKHWKEKDTEQLAMIKAIMGQHKDVNKGLLDNSLAKAENGSAALGTLTVAARIEDTLISGKVASGVGIETVQKFRSAVKAMTNIDLAGAWKNVFGTDLASLPDAQVLAGLSNAQAAATLADKALGHNPSNRDLEIILSTLPNLGLELEASLAMVDVIKKKAMKSAEDGRDGFEFILKKEPDLPMAKRFEERYKTTFDQFNKNFNNLDEQVGKLLTSSWQQETNTPVPAMGTVGRKEFNDWRIRKAKESNPLGRQIRSLATLKGFRQ